MMKPGQTFADRFKIEELIGLGAYGAVYRVKQLSTGATRALKVLRDELGARMEVQQRFNEEATLAARIDSDHVAQIIDAGSRPRPWIAMELVEGDTLRARVKKGHPLPISEVLLILSQLAHGVAAAHRAQIVHRDLKPDNILISNARHSGAEFTTKIVDFGIARYRPREIEITKGAVGATMWMAPEQLEPTKSHEILPQADIWAFGLIAFFMLVHGEYWQSRDEQTLQAEIKQGAQVLASRRARELATELPRGFDDWFKRCVALQPADRFPSIERAFEELRRALLPPRNPTEEFAYTIVLREAARDAAHRIKPMHILGALTRHWVIGCSYWEMVGPAYIQQLVALREVLQVSEWPAEAPLPEHYELDEEATAIVKAMRERSGGKSATGLELLRTLCEMNPLGLDGALSKLDAGPNTLNQLVSGTSRWLHNGGTPPAAIVLPNGRFDASLWLPEFAPAAASAVRPTRGSISPWTLLLALGEARGFVGEYCQSNGLTSLGSATWQAGSELWWSWLDDAARNVVIEAMGAHPGEALTEQLVFRSLSKVLKWAELPAPYRRRLQNAGLDLKPWDEHVQALFLKTF